jgi:DNA-binding NtrC family response regulator
VRDVDALKLIDSDLKNISTSEKIDMDLGLTALLERYEKTILINALDQTKNEIDATAELLKISRSSLYKKIKDHQIEVLK